MFRRLPKHFSKLDRRLAVGSLPADDHLAGIVRAGFNGLLCLQQEAELQALGVDWAERTRRLEALGVRALRVEIEDFVPDALLLRLDDALRALVELHREGRSVYVHCHAGLNRSPSVCIASLMQAKHWSVREAWRYVEKRHRCMPYEEVLVAWATRHRYALE